MRWPSPAKGDGRCHGVQLVFYVTMSGDNRNRWRALGYLLSDEDLSLVVALAEGLCDPLAQGSTDSMRISDTCEIPLTPEPQTIITCGHEPPAPRRRKRSL